MKFQLTGKFGELAEVRGMKPHTGIDFSMPEGTKLRSLFDGTVEKVYHGGKIGNGVSVQTGDGSHIIYGHMKQVSVHVGDKVHSGELIGLSGNTGNSTGPHLHFGMKDDTGHFIDPTSYADKVSGMSGDLPSFIPGPMQAAENLFGSFKDHAGNAVREHAADMTHDIALGIWDGVCDVLVEVIGSITLIGTGILIILKIAGFDKGYKWAGILNVINILVKTMLKGAN
jgi:hypothetical protein